MYPWALGDMMGHCGLTNFNPLRDVDNEGGTASVQAGSVTVKLKLLFKKMLLQARHGGTLLLSQAGQLSDSARPCLKIKNKKEAKGSAQGRGPGFILQSPPHTQAVAPAILSSRLQRGIAQQAGPHQVPIS